MTRVLVSVVSGARGENLLRFLDSISGPQATDLAMRVRAIVNDGDERIATCVGRYDAVEAVRREAPLGFAANHNSSIRVGGFDYVVIANDDVVASARAIEQLVEFMEQPQNSRVAVVSPRLLNLDGTLQPSTYSFPSVPRSIVAISGLRSALGTGRFAATLARFVGYRTGQSRMWAHDRQIDVDTLRGAFVVVRAAAIDEVGCMDEVCLVGGEETEWHRRMSERGWRVVFLPAVEVLHEGGATVGGRVDLEIEYLRGLLNYFAKHGTPSQLRLLRIIGTPVLAVRAAGSALLGRQAARDRWAQTLLMARGPLGSAGSSRG